MIASTLRCFGSSTRMTVAPYLHSREIDGIIDAIDTGELVAIVSEDSTHVSEIVALATPDLADEIVKRDNEVVKELQLALADASKELEALKTIIGEVFAEDTPADHRWKLDEAARDVREELDNADLIAEQM